MRVSQISLALATIAITAMSSFSIAAPATGPASIPAQVLLGVGYNVCPPSASLPPLTSALECSGLIPDPQKVNVVMVQKPSQNPAWLYYEAPVYTTTVTFNNLTSKIEILVAYADLGNGVTKGYVDGRVITTDGKKTSDPIYFRVSADGGLQNLSYTQSIGQPMTYISQNTKLAYSPLVAIVGAK